MSSTYATEGIILDKRYWRETDSRVTVFTHESGKLDLIARGTAKLSSRLSGHLEPINRVRLMVVDGRAKSYVGAVDSIDCHLNIKKDLDKLIWVSYWLKTFNAKVQAGQADRSLYHLLVASLATFNNMKSTQLYYQALANIYVLKLMELMGEGIDWRQLQVKSLNPARSQQMESIKLILNDIFSGAPKLTKAQAELAIELPLSFRN